VIARAWWLLIAALLAMVASWGAAPQHPEAPWTSLQAMMWLGVAFSLAGVAAPHRWRQTRTLIVAAGFLGRAAIVSTGVVGFPSWKSTVIASTTYATVGAAVVLLHVGWEQVRASR